MSKRKIFPLVVLAVLIAFSSAGSAQDIELNFTKAQEYFQAGKLDEAADEFSIVVEILLKNKMVNEARTIMGNIAVIRLQQERYAEAIATLEEALAFPGKISPDILTKSTKNIVFAAEKIGDYVTMADAIARLFDAKIKLDSTVKANYLALQGDAYRLLGLYKPAVESYQQALSSKSYPKEKRPTLLTTLGLSQGNLGMYSEALNSLETANKEAKIVNDSTAMVESMSNMGIIRWELGQLPEALKDLQVAQDLAKEFKLRRNEGVDYNNIGAVYKTAGQWQKAIASFDNAYEIAKEVGNRRDEAIALNNRALLEKLTGYPEAALKDYQAALALYREVGFMEGVATTLIGLADMDTDNYQYQAALEKLLQAKDIYEKQSLVFQLARVYIQLGELYKKTVRSPMTTRDLVFEDYEITVVSLDISSDEALRISDEYFAKAEKIAERYSITNLLWKAFQGRAFVLKQSGDLPKAEKLYEKAINMVLSMKGFEENSELLLHYLKDKDDLFTEAIEVCNSLYQQTKDESFLRKQMEYDEIYRNEILKANMQMGNIEYTDPEKRSLFDSLKQLDAKSKKADKAAQAAAFAAEAPKSSKATKIALEQAQQESKLIKEQYEKYLSQWKATFKNDSVMFDSEGKIDINALKRFLTDDQAIIQYIPLPDKLTIIVITKESIISVEKEVSTNELEKLIRNDYIANSIEKFGRIEPNKTEEADKLYQETMDQLIRMSELLYIPIQQHLVGKDRLFIVTSKFLSYVPYNALIIGIVDNQRPKFLVEEKVISLVRYSFLDNALNNISKSYNKNIISLGNPQHTIMSSVLGNLPGAEAESAKIKNIVENHAQNLLFKNFIRNDARKETFISEIQNNKYGIMHFSTHGVPFSEIIFSNKKFQNYIDKPEEKKLKTLKKAKINKAYNDKIFTNNSHFNGFLMMSADENDLKKGSLSLNDLLAMDEENFNANYMDYINSLDTDSKLLTIKDIISMNDGLFSEAYLALLSACNTAVSFTSKVIASEDFETSSEYADLDDDDIKTIPKEMADLGWTPGLDEVCFVDIFMRKNFQYVLGSLWFLPDASTALIMEYFMVNLLSGESKDPPEALTEAMRTYLNYVSTGGKVSYIKPLHPFYWAGGNIFGI